MFKTTLKLALKFAVVMVALMGICALLPGSKVAADSTGSNPNCPDTTANMDNYPQLGYHRGENDDGFGGVTVMARYAPTYNDGSANPGANAPINTNFRLNSALPGLPSGDHYINRSSGNSDASVNARIFALDPSNPIRNPNSRTASHLFGTGTNVYTDVSSQSSPDNGPSFVCNGLTVLGPGVTYTAGGGGTVQEYGDRWALDCGEAWTDGSGLSGPAHSGTNATRFWIDSIPNPNGEDGWWEVVEGNPAPQAPTDYNGSTNSADASHNYFSITNGVTQHVQLIWHANKPKPKGNGTAGACTDVQISNTGSGNSNNRRVFVEITGISLGRRIDRNWNAAAGRWDNTADVQYSSDPSHTTDDYGDSSARPRSVASWVGDNGAGGDHGLGPGDTSQQKEWYFLPWKSNSIHVKVTVEDFWDNTGDGVKNPTWNTIAGYPQYLSGDNTWSGSDVSVTCYSGTCNVLSATGYGPGGIVLANDRISVHATLTNTSIDSLQLWGSQLVGAGGTQSSGVVLDPGDTHDFYFDIGAPNAIEDYNSGNGFTFHPEYPSPGGGGRIGGDCSGSATIYQQFSATPSALSSLLPNTEHPTQGANYNNSVNVKNDLSHDVGIPTRTEFYKLSAGGSKTSLASYSSYPGDRTYNSSPWCPSNGCASGGHDNTVTSGHYDIPSSSYDGGDEYCASIHIEYTSGYVGPSNEVVYGTGPGDSSNCPRIANEPYFKVLNSGITAGGDFDQRTSNGGLLAGYNDISDPANADRGASSQLSALALIKITGVASAQTPGNITRSPADLTFANTGVTVDSTGPESPVLGGAFGGQVQLTNETAPASATNIPGLATSANRASGAYTHSGDLRITGGNLPANRNVSIFVTGNIYISGNVTYNQSVGWTNGTAPSLILHATGNIYIKPSVSRLAGLYIAQKDTSGNGGKIYTCADASGYAAMQAQNLYSCNNQLVITGSFVADQVNLMRTFGSLRDEEPDPGTSGGATENVQWSSCGSYGHPVGGESCLPASGQNGLRCVNVNEPSDPPGGGYSYWSDNVLCVPNSSTLQLAWTHFDNSPYNDPRHDPGKSDSGMLNEDYWRSYFAAQGYGGLYCTQWNATDPDTWQDNELCMNKARPDGTAWLHFVSTPTSGESCINISELSDPDGQWKTGYYLCQPSGAATLPRPRTATYTACSNSSGAIQVYTGSCAAEVFEFSPQLYLTPGGITCPAGGCSGPVQFQSLTNLPPVL